MKRSLLFNSKVFCLLVVIGFNTVVWGQKNNHQASIKKDVSKNKIKTQMISLSTYILFNGNCRQAMEFYDSCFGGELTQTTVGQSPMKNVFPENMHNKIVNARLVGKNIDISASDWLRPSQTPVQGNMVCLYLNGGKPGELQALFNKLSVGATITDPLKIEPFGTYGALNDRFGIRWMFHTDEKG
jgi:PhnB protein